MAEDPVEDELYEFAPEISGRPGRSIPSPPPPKPNEPVMLSYRVPKVEPRRPADTDTIKNVYMPLALLGGGVLIEFVVNMIRTGSPGMSLVTVAIQLVLGTVAMLGGIFMAAKIRGINLGSSRALVLKLAAISVAPSAVVDLIGPALRLVPMAGGLLALVVQFILFFALLGALFDLDESDTWFCVWAIFLVDLLVSFGMARGW